MVVYLVTSISGLSGELWQDWEGVFSTKEKAEEAIDICLKRIANDEHRDPYGANERDDYSITDITIDEI